MPLKLHATRVFVLMAISAQVVQINQNFAQTDSSLVDSAPVQLMTARHVKRVTTAETQLQVSSARQAPTVPFNQLTNQICQWRVSIL